MAFFFSFSLLLALPCVREAQDYIHQSKDLLSNPRFIKTPDSSKKLRIAVKWDLSVACPLYFC